MNLKNCMGLALVMAFAFAASAQACDKKCSKSSATTVASKSETGSTGEAKPGCCSKGAKTVAEGGTAGDAKPGCCSKGAKTVATAGSEGEAKPGCGSKTATTVATAGSEGEAKSGCGGKSATTVVTVGSEGAAKSGCGGKSATTVAAGGCCKTAGAVKAVLASMPAMTYKVGEVETPCIVTAAAKAEEAKSDIQFIVAGKSFADRDEANDALTALLEARVAEMTEITFVAGEKTFKCPLSAGEAAKEASTTVRYRLAGFDFDCKDKASAAAKKASEAVSAVAMSYVDGEGQPVGCLHSAKASGKTVAFVVGEEKTECEHMAKLLLAQAKAKVFVETIAASL